MMDFDWDPQKAASNLKKHEVAFTEAATIFADPQSMTMSDEIHSIDEERYRTLGRDTKGRTLVVIHTFRVLDGEEVVRLISARKADKDEEAVYYGLEDANERPL